DSLQRIVKFVGDGGAQLPYCRQFLSPAKNLLVSLALCNVHCYTQAMGLAVVLVVKLATFTQPDDLPITSDQPHLNFCVAFTKHSFDCRLNFRFVVGVNQPHPALKFSICRNPAQCWQFREPSHISTLHVPVKRTDVRHSVRGTKSLLACPQCSLGTLALSDV